MDWGELGNWTEYSQLLVGLFAISGPFSALPVYFGLTADRTETEKRQVLLVAVLAFTVTLLIFTFFGQGILNVFGISLAGFRIAGGLLLLLSALDMMRSEPGGESAGGSSKESAVSLGIVPLAIPFLSGPGAISTIIIYADAHRSFEHLILVSMVIVSVALLIYIIFRLALTMGTFLGGTTMLVVNRVMGLIVASIGIEFIIHGIAEHFPDLTILHF